MTLPSVTDANYPTHAEIRDGILRTIRYGFARRGLVANVLEGSDQWYRADALARRVSIAIANGKIGRQNMSPLDSQDDALVELASVFGVNERPASTAAGYVTIKCTGTISIPADFQCTAGTGRKFKTTSTNASIATAASVQVEALAAGKASNLTAGEPVTWDSAAIGQLDHQATVAAGGIDGGAEADDTETLRARLIDRLSFPATGNNWAQTKLDAENASAAVLVAFVYPAMRGPSSEDVAVVGAAGDGVLSSTTVTRVSSAILAKMPGHQNLNATGILNQELDVVLAATLPLPASAGGAGGGWRDAAPWPAENVKVTAYNPTTGVATVNGSTAPTVGAQIGLWDPTAAAMLEKTILTVSGSGPWTITVEGGFGFDPTGVYISAGAVGLVAYATAAFVEFGPTKLGPGEKTTSLDILPRARRHPTTDLAYPSDLTRVALGAITKAYPEILDLDYAARFETGTTTTRTSPSIPPTTADPPRRLKVKHFAIRKA
jgi:uncharacterized phage protein gp47/JayE